VMAILAQRRRNAPACCKTNTDSVRIARQVSVSNELYVLRQTSRDRAGRRVTQQEVISN